MESVRRPARPAALPARNGLSRFWMPCFSVAVDDGQPAQAPFMCRNTVPFSIAAEGDVAAVLGHGRAHARLQQFLDGDDDLGRPCRRTRRFRRQAHRASTWRHDRRARHEMLHDGAEDGRLQVLPVGAAVLGDGDEIVAEEHAGDAGDVEQPAGQRRSLARAFGIAEIGGACAQALPCRAGISGSPGSGSPRSG